MVKIEEWARNQVWWPMSLIPGLERQKQVDLYEFGAIMVS
ncbi:rCG63124 [Rattus norvegicus]|uniref:RCG63124 n=1 Tax=Rattus norvegicus TaxID=10116 RepID=A6KJJ0_RAT|nr:rCG63124 [Rattus norvegicus]